MARTRGGLQVGERAVGKRATVWVEADRDRPSGRMLLIDGFPSSFVDLDDPRYLHFDYVRALAALLDARALDGDVLHIGGGGCTVARYLLAAHPEARNIVYEPDETVLQVAREQLGLRTGPRLQVKVTDGVAGLRRRPERSAAAVVVDAFDGPDVPPAFLEEPFLHLARRVLRPGGLYLLNLIDDPPFTAGRVAVATLRDLFEDVALVADRPTLRGTVRGNLVLAACDDRLPLQLLRARLAAEGHPLRVLYRDQLTSFSTASARAEGRAAAG
jgi:spermidine synthase